MEVLIVYMSADKKEVYLNQNLSEGREGHSGSGSVSVLDVLKSSGFYATYPEAEGLPVGIFSKRVTLDTLVKAGDRIEVYRPLLISPKDRRRQKAALAKKKNPTSTAGF
jgi:putative ubiquitin-RnfH superfamily antitoxin RatB of RatAB toxin-antitoxin module